MARHIGRSAARPVELAVKGSGGAENRPCSRPVKKGGQVGQIGAEGVGEAERAHPKKTGGSDIHVGISADQVIAQANSTETRLASLELGLDDSRVVGHCDSGYSCAYTNSISWRTPSTPLAPEANPRVIFERLFGDVDTSLDAATRARRERSRA